MAVVIQHAWHEFDGIKTATFLHLDENSLYPWEAGVDVFFVISGFIMWVSASKWFGEPGASWEFIRRRLIRIVPLYWLCSAVILAVLLSGIRVFDRVTLDWSHILASFLFFPSVSETGLRSPILIPGWTLNYEMMFYALFALALFLNKKAGLYALLVAFVLLSVAGPFISQDLVAPYFWTRPIILEFAAGILIGVAYERGISLPAAAVVGLMIAGVVALAVSHHFFDRNILRPLVWGVPCAMIVAGAALHHLSTGNLLTRPLPILIGDASYSLYLSHSFTLGLLTLLWRKLGVGVILPDWSYLPISVAASTLIGILLFKLVEDEITGKLRSIGNKA